MQFPKKCLEESSGHMNIGLGDVARGACGEQKVAKLESTEVQKTGQERVRQRTLEERFLNSSNLRDATRDSEDSFHI